MKIINKILAITVIGLILISFYFAINYIKKPSKAIDFSFTDINGNEHNLSDFYGKVIVLDFMATWCNPCIKMIDNLKEIEKKYPEIVVISIDVDSSESVEKLQRFKEEHEIDWIITIDKGGISKKYSVVGIPKTVIINPKEEIVFSHIGVVSISDLAKEIEKAIYGEKSEVILINLGLPVIAIIAGILSFFSPCSFPLLPAYIGFYLSKKRGDEKRKIIKEGILKGVQPALGILFFYALIGIFIIVLGESIKNFIPYFEPIIGILIIILGIIMVLKVVIFSKFSSIAGKLSKYVSGSKFDLFIYGVIYGAASAGCAMPIFISIILLTISIGSFLESIAVFMLYVAGMMLLMIAITILVAFSAETIDKLKFLSKYIENIGGILLIFAGLILLYYAFS